MITDPNLPKVFKSTYSSVLPNTNSVWDFPFLFPIHWRTPETNSCKNETVKQRSKLLRCWEKPCSNRLALDASQSFLTCRGVRGLFCSGHVKESGHVNTAVRVSSEVWSGLLREGFFEGFKLPDLCLTFCEDVCSVVSSTWEIKSPHPHYITPSIAYLSASLIARISLKMLNKGALSFPFPLNSHGLHLKLETGTATL